METNGVTRARLERGLFANADGDGQEDASLSEPTIEVVDRRGERWEQDPWDVMLEALIAEMRGVQREGHPGAHERGQAIDRLIEGRMWRNRSLHVTQGT